MMYYLYVKTHKTTGLKYLGVTQQNPYKYKSSGTDWQTHIEKYGYNVFTDVIGFYANPEELMEAGLYYSKIWDIVKSDEWANLIPENGKQSIRWSETYAEIPFIERSEAEISAEIFMKDSHFSIDT